MSFGAFATRQHARGLKIRQVLLGHLLLETTVLRALFHDDCADSDKDEVKDQQLRTLSISGADVSLKQRISEREHRREDDDRRHLSQAMLQRIPQPEDQQGKREPPNNHFRQSDNLAQRRELARKRREHQIEQY